ncbi:hypothetical protein LZ30DRAFT_788063 [Colletotrichum cereale]|nr:hypothetical protein LZ30DRAFT_788063 [Colletotrichum cereale]
MGKRRGMLVAVSTNAAIISGFQYKKHAIQKNIPYWLAIKFYWKALLGCSSAWLLDDVVVCPFNLLAPTLVSGFSSQQTIIKSIGWPALINAFAPPGAFISTLLLDRIRRRQTMIQLNNVFPLFVMLYGLFQTFLSVRPRDCNFLVSSGLFLTPLRGHFLGFVAAVGKAAAAIGTTALSAAVVASVVLMRWMVCRVV